MGRLAEGWQHPSEGEYHSSDGRYTVMQQARAQWILLVMVRVSCVVRRYVTMQVTQNFGTPFQAITFANRMDRERRGLIT